MAKKAKPETEPQIESLNEAFDPATEPQDQASTIDPKDDDITPLASWREVTEDRKFNIDFTSEERDKLTNELVEVIKEIGSLEDSKKSAASSYKAKIDDATVHRDTIIDSIEKGSKEVKVSCRWAFQCSGLDENDNEIFHPEMKALIRADTNEVVEVIHMIEKDFENQELALDDQKTEQNIVPFGPSTIDEDDDVLYDD